MHRDTLLAHLIGMPPTTDVLIQVGEVEVEIIGVQRDGALLPHPVDLRDALVETGLPVEQANEVTRVQRKRPPSHEDTDEAGSAP